MIHIIPSILVMTLALLASPENPCKAEKEKFCKDIKPGHHRVYDCLVLHEADLSPACKERQVQAKEKLEKIQKACEEWALTKGAEKKKVPPACKETLKKMRAKK